ncbi:MAG: hypothetical protein IKW39_03400, partial [Alphaproteobacteria bacterium]|nr:hypothetical protein [Alphaproteobacteria bacterium]
MQNPKSGLVKHFQKNEELTTKLDEVISSAEVDKIKTFLSTNHFCDSVEYQVIVSLSFSNFSDNEVEDLICFYIQHHGLTRRSQFLLFDLKFEKPIEYLLRYGSPSDEFLEMLWNNISEKFFESLEVKSLVFLQTRYYVEANISILNTIIKYSCILIDGGQTILSTVNIDKIKKSITKDVKNADFYELTIDGFREILKKNLIKAKLSSALIRNEETDEESAFTVFDE